MRVPIGTVVNYMGDYVEIIDYKSFDGYCSPFYVVRHFDAKNGQDKPMEQNVNCSFIEENCKIASDLEIVLFSKTLRTK